MFLGLIHLFPISLEDNRIGAEGAAAVAEALKLNNSLTVLL